MVCIELLLQVTIDQARRGLAHRFSTTWPSRNGKPPSLTGLRDCGSDYLVDGESLGQAFRFESNRPWFGQTCFEYDGEFLNESILQLRGLKPPQNQFKTDRFVLYRCHCGDDNCGILSCGIQRIENVIRWTDVRFENDDGPTDDEMYDGCIPLFEFDVTEYDAAIVQFIETRG